MHEGEWDIPWGYVVGTVGLSVAAGALYYGYCTKEKVVWNAPVPVVETKASDGNLESFD